MKEKILKFIKSDSVLKVLSVILAFILWFAIVDANNPLDNKSLRVSYILGVSGETLFIDGDTFKNVESVDTRIDLSLRGRKEILDNTSAEDFTVSLDLTDVNESGVQNVPLIVKSDKIGVSVADYSPKTISVNFEKIIEASYPVSVKVGNNVIEEGYVIAKTSVSPQTIQLRGFESIINRISTVQVHVEKVDIDAKIDQSKSMRMICKYFDADGNEVTDLDINESVDVTITAGREVQLNYNVTGTPDSGSYEKEVTITPSTVVIIGSPSVISDIESLGTSEVSIEGINEDLSTPVDIVLPYGVTLADPSLKPTVTVKLGGVIDRRINIGNDKVTVSHTNSDYLYTIKSVSQLVINGKDVTVNDIDETSLKARVDVASYGEGTHSIPVSVTLPSGVRIVSNAYAEVIISRKNVETPTPDVTPTIEPTPSPTEEPNEDPLQITENSDFL